MLLWLLHAKDKETETERVSDLPKGTQLQSSRAQSQTQTAWLQSLWT